MGAIRNSIRRGAGNAVGFLAEIMLADYLGCERTPCKDYDLTWNGTTIDVKTKETTVPPRTITIAALQRHRCTSSVISICLLVTYDKVICMFLDGLTKTNTLRMLGS